MNSKNVTPGIPRPQRPMPDMGMPQMPMPFNPYQMPQMPQMPPIAPAPQPDLRREDGPPVLTDTEFLQGYLRTLIGNYVRIDFLIGTNTFVDKEGTLVDVGVDHVVLQEPETDDKVVADLYSIKFVKIFQ